MMKKYTTRFHVDVPPAMAFAYIKDPTSTMPGMSKMEVVHETPDGVGSTWRYEERFLGMRFTGLFVVTEYIENKRIKGEFSGGLEEGEGTWTFKRAAGGTDVTIESGFRIRIPIVGPLAGRLMMRSGQRRWIPTLQKEMEKYARTAHTTKTAA
jgi:carbon monoxide dehydrogenase subunit G